MYDLFKEKEKMKYKNHLVFLILFLFFSFGCDGPKLTGVEFEKIDTSQDPLQTPCTSEEPIIREIKNGIFTITPVAEYKLYVMVVSKETYSDDWDGKISPIDLAIVWGKLAEPDYDKYITYSQSSRWYHYKWKAGTPFDASYVVSHSGNNHIIPANENIHKAIKTIRKKDKVVLEGFLVNLNGTYKGKAVAWNTSLSRTDSGNGSCELFYVTKVRIDINIFE